MTSLFSRLQKLNKEGTKPPWWISHHPDNVEHFIEPEVATVEDELKDADAELVVECRNSLPAVLNLIQTVLDVVDEDEHAGKRRHPTKLEVAVAPFVEEQP